MRRAIYAVVGCDVCGNPDDKGVAVAAYHQRGLVQVCNPCLYEMSQEANSGIRLEKLAVEEESDEEAEDIDVPVTRRANYYGPDWPDIRLRILGRDGRKCQGAGHDDKFNGGDHSLVVHHVRPLRTFGSDYNAANVPENLITLCTICHGRAHAELNAQAKAAQQ